MTIGIKDIIIALVFFLTGWGVHYLVAPMLVEPEVRTTQTIFEKGSGIAAPLTMQVDKVVVVQEAPDSLIVDVHYTYQDDKVPAEQVKMFVLPNMPYWASNSITVARGSHVGRLSIDLYEKKMKEDQVFEYQTSKLTVSFDHYAPDKFKGSLAREIIPFMKTWKRRVK